METKVLKFETVEEFLKEKKKKFEKRDNELKKIAELKEVEQGQGTMEEYI